MDILEYAVGFGGWIAVASLIVFCSQGTVTPVIVCMTPVISICLTYIVLQMFRYTSMLLVWVIQTMLRGDVLLYAFSIFVSGLVFHTIISTLKLIRNERIEEVD
jgi:hypothetical protein